MTWSQEREREREMIKWKCVLDMRTPCFWPWKEKYRVCIPNTHSFNIFPSSFLSYLIQKVCMYSFCKYVQRVHTGEQHTVSYYYPTPTLPPFPPLDTLNRQVIQDILMELIQFFFSFYADLRSLLQRNPFKYRPIWRFNYKLAIWQNMILLQGHFYYVCDIFVGFQVLFAGIIIRLGMQFLLRAQ